MAKHYRTIQKDGLSVSYSIDISVDTTKPKPSNESILETIKTDCKTLIDELYKTIENKTDD